MDYVFFAFTAMCLGLAVLLALVLLLRSDQRVRSWHVIVAGLSAAAYYYLDVSFFQNEQTLLYLSNMIPQIILLLELAFSFLRKPRS
jgi:hypothetical protein